MDKTFSYSFFSLIEVKPLNAAKLTDSRTDTRTDQTGVLYWF